MVYAREPLHRIRSSIDHRTCEQLNGTAFLRICLADQNATFSSVRMNKRLTQSFLEMCFEAVLEQKRGDSRIFRRCPGGDQRLKATKYVGHGLDTHWHRRLEPSRAVSDQDRDEKRDNLPPRNLAQEPQESHHCGACDFADPGR